MHGKDQLIRVPAGGLAPHEQHLTPEDLRDQLEKLGNADPEAGHGLVDDLMREALIAIRDGHAEPQALAAAVLYAEGADFLRWYA